MQVENYKYANVDKIRPYSHIELMRKEEGISHATKQREYKEKKLEYGKGICWRGRLTKKPGLIQFRTFTGALFKIRDTMCRKCLRRYEQYWVITAVLDNLYMITAWKVQLSASGNTGHRNLYATKKSFTRSIYQNNKACF